MAFQLGRGRNNDTDPQLQGVPKLVNKNRKYVLSIDLIRGIMTYI